MSRLILEMVKNLSRKEEPFGRKQFEIIRKQCTDKIDIGLDLHYNGKNHFFRISCYEPFPNGNVVIADKEQVSAPLFVNGRAVYNALLYFPEEEDLNTLREHPEYHKNSYQFFRNRIVLLQTFGGFPYKGPCFKEFLEQSYKDPYQKAV
ncbi:MAG TPA: hypothetical protein VL576_01150 [Candidatus Paceibacterota bacterium]|jgi:hypothetical protein|nr:hypothetical protein [Candidatus Paceibacterota bacterium]